MPEITVKNEAQELLDECMYLAEYTLKDEDFAPEKIPTPVIVPSPPKVSQEGIRKSERNSQGVGAITRSLQNSQNLQESQNKPKLDSQMKNEEEEIPAAVMQDGMSEQNDIPPAPVLDVSCESDQEEKSQNDVDMIIQDDDKEDSAHSSFLNSSDQKKMQEMYDRCPEKFQAIIDKNKFDQNSLNISIDEEPSLKDKNLDSQSED